MPGGEEVAALPDGALVAYRAAHASALNEPSVEL
jgi:hypothetical protein